MYYFKNRFFIDTCSVTWFFKRVRLGMVTNGPAGRKFIAEGFEIRIPNKIK